MEKNLVSVLMVNYNHADTIEKAIRSVLEQTYSKLQLIVVDDGSTDDSVEIIKSIEDPRLELYEEKENRQICVVTNIGMQKVRGEYFARIDSDDLWEKNKLELQLEYLKEHPEHKICFTHAAIIDEKDQVIESELEKLYAVNYETQAEWLETFFFIGNCLPMTSVLMTTKLMVEIGYFNVAYRQLHDFDYWVRVAKKYPMAVLTKKLVRMRRYENETNNSNTSEKNTARTYNEYVDIRRHFFDNMSDELFKKTFGKYFKNSNAESVEELECEKAFLLCRPIGTSRIISNIGVEYFINLLQNKAVTDILKRKYGFNVKQFYELTEEHLYNDWGLQEAAISTKKKIEAFENEMRKKEQQKQLMEKSIEEKENRINELEKELKIRDRLIDEYKNSTSWKLTKPLRKIGTIVKK